MEFVAPSGLKMRAWPFVHRLESRPRPLSPHVDVKRVQLRRQGKANPQCFWEQAHNLELSFMRSQCQLDFSQVTGSSQVLPSMDYFQPSEGFARPCTLRLRSPLRTPLIE